MPRHIWVNPKRLKSAVATENIDGTELVIGISAYSLPQFVVGRYEKKAGRFIIEFKYIDDEKASTRPRTIEGIEIREGKSSGKILSISLPIDKSPLHRISVIELRTKILKAFRQRSLVQTDTRRSSPPDAMNQEVAAEILDEKNFAELTEELVAS